MGGKGSGRKKKRGRPPKKMVEVKKGKYGTTMKYGHKKRSYKQRGRPRLKNRFAEFEKTSHPYHKQYLIAKDYPDYWLGRHEQKRMPKFTIKPTTRKDSWGNRRWTYSEVYHKKVLLQKKWIPNDTLSKLKKKKIATVTETIPYYEGTPRKIKL